MKLCVCPAQNLSGSAGIKIRTPAVLGRPALLRSSARNQGIAAAMPCQRWFRGRLRLNQIACFEPLNPVGTRSTASLISLPAGREMSGTEWNPSLPGSGGVPAVVVQTVKAGSLFRRDNRFQRPRATRSRT